MCLVWVAIAKLKNMIIGERLMSDKLVKLNMK